jgi:hypothetical protein
MTTPRVLPAELAAARKRFEEWRATGRARRPLPPELWRLAAGLVRTHGVCPVASALRLEYYKLKEQAEGMERSRRRQVIPAPPPGLPQTKPAFVQVVPTATFPASHDVVVEMTDTEGRHLSIRSHVAVDMMALVRAFCGRAP